MLPIEKRKNVMFNQGDYDRYIKLGSSMPFPVRVKQLLYNYLDEMELKILERQNELKEPKKEEPIKHDP